MNTSVSIKDVIKKKELNVIVTIKGLSAFRLRLMIARNLISLASIVAGLKIKTIELDKELEKRNE